MNHGVFAEVGQGPRKDAIADKNMGLVAVISMKETKGTVYLSEKHWFVPFPYIDVTHYLKTKVAAKGNNRLFGE